MSRVYDNWERLVGAALDREELRRIAFSESLSSLGSADFSPGLSFDSSIPESRNSGETFDPADPSSQIIFFFRNVRAIEYKEIKKATRNFQDDILLGEKENRFGLIYKGQIDEHSPTATMHDHSGMAVAVMKLAKEIFQGDTGWLDEINYLSQLHHPNLVKLIGYCFEEDNRILVYEFMPRGSLENYSFRRGNPSLSWAIRIKVAIGAARALSFLHDLAIPVIYRDFKSSNILLDGEFNAKLSVFGSTGDMTHVSAQIMGAYGYVAPEYIATGHQTIKCDVYGFGVVLLELLSGLQTFDINRPLEERNLVERAKPYLANKKGLLKIIMDPRIQGQYPRKEAYKVAKLACQCLDDSPKRRPIMAEVVVALEQL